MNEVAPCKGCTNRHTACHGSCEAYKEWRDRYHAQQKHLQAAKTRHKIPLTVSRERAIRGYIKSGVLLRDHGGMK